MPRGTQKRPFFNPYTLLAGRSIGEAWSLLKNVIPACPELDSGTPIRNLNLYVVMLNLFQHLVFHPASCLSRRSEAKTDRPGVVKDARLGDGEAMRSREGCYSFPP
jgi:hypothetical protein